MKTRNLWPYGIITAFIVFISGTVSLIVLACSNKIELVNTNYYEQEIRFQEHIDSVRRTQKIANDASVAFDQAAQKIAISVPLAPGGATCQGSIHLYRPSAASLDREFSLQTGLTTQLIDTSDLKPGLWIVRVAWRANHQEFFIEKKVVVERPISYGNSAVPGRSVHSIAAGIDRSKWPGRAETAAARTTALRPIAL